MEDRFEKISKTLDTQARSLVGILCKRLEVLSSQGTRDLDIGLFKKLAKELVYENFRNLKTIIKVQLEIGKVVFRNKPDTKE